MKKFPFVWLLLLTLITACHTPVRAPTSPVIVLPTADFSQFSLIRLTPTTLPAPLNKHLASKKSAAQLNRELLILLSKNLKRQKIAPTNMTISKSMLNIIPHFRIREQSLILQVIFQNNMTQETVATETFEVSNKWRKGFTYSATDRVLLANLAQQIVSCMVRAQPKK